MKYVTHTNTHDIRKYDDDYEVPLYSKAYPTFEDAKKGLIRRQELRIMTARTNLGRAKEAIKRIRRMKE